MVPLMTPVTCAWILFLISEFFAIWIFCNLVSFHVYAWDGSMWIYKTHLVGMPVVGLIVNGHGMVMFRLLPGYNSTILKYAHALIEIIVFGLGWIFSWSITRFKRDNSKLPDFRHDKMHRYIGDLIQKGFVIQFLLAVLVYVYMYRNQKRRLIFAIYHNFFGIILFHMLTINSVNTFYYVVKTHNEQTPGIPDQFVGAVTILMIFIYNSLINAILLNPYLEWPAGSI